MPLTIPCIVGLTGQAINVTVQPTASATGRCTADRLVRDLHVMLGGTPFRVDVLLPASDVTGPARALAGDDDVMNEVAGAPPCILMCSARNIDRFPALRLNTSVDIQQCFQRQVMVFKTLVCPADNHLEVAQREEKKTRDLLTSLDAEFKMHAERLAAYCAALKTVPLVDDSDKTLADKVGNVASIVDGGRVALGKCRGDLDVVASTLESVAGAVRREASSMPASAVTASQESYDAMKVEIVQRMDRVRQLLKSVEYVRRDVGKTVQGVKAVRDGDLVKLRMLESLPESYKAALGVAERRLVFQRATSRVRQMLQVEHEELVRELADFMATFGARFPTNLLPGIQTPPTLLQSTDPVADFLKSHVVDLDEDAPSVLLARLGLVALRDTETQALLQQERERCDALKAENTRLHLAMSDAETSDSNSSARLAETESSLHKLEKALAKARAQLCDEREKSADLETALEQAKAELQKQRDAADASQEELKAAHRYDLDGLSKERARLIHSNEETVAERDELKRQLDDARASTGGTSSRVAELEDALAAAKVEQTQQRVAAKAELEDAQRGHEAQLAEQAKAVADLHDKLRQRQCELARMAEELAAATTRAENALSEAEILRVEVAKLSPRRPTAQTSPMPAGSAGSSSAHLASGSSSSRARECSDAALQQLFKTYTDVNGHTDFDLVKRELFEKYFEGRNLKFVVDEQKNVVAQCGAVHVIVDVHRLSKKPAMVTAKIRELGGVDGQVFEVHSVSKTGVVRAEAWLDVPQ